MSSAVVKNTIWTKPRRQQINVAKITIFADGALVEGDKVNNITVSSSLYEIYTGTMIWGRWLISITTKQSSINNFHLKFG